MIGAGATEVYPASLQSVALRHRVFGRVWSTVSGQMVEIGSEDALFWLALAVTEGQRVALATL